MVLCCALDGLALRLDRSRASANTITRKRAVFHGALGYAVEIRTAGLQPSRPDQLTVPKTCHHRKPEGGGQHHAGRGPARRGSPDPAGPRGVLRLPVLRRAAPGKRSAVGSSAPARLRGQLVYGRLGLRTLRTITSTGPITSLMVAPAATVAVSAATALATTFRVAACVIHAVICPPTIVDTCVGTLLGGLGYLTTYLVSRKVVVADNG